ncbi:MAG: glycosyltransferase family 4 protein [Pseudonocardiaceae bacterium]
MRDGVSDLLVVLTYYSPYVSGLTNVAREVAEGLAARGYRITVVTSQHDRGLPTEEIINGVRVLRAPVWTRVGKGTISPQLARLALREARHARVVNLHLPMLDAGLIARASDAPVVVTYHCDVSLPPARVTSRWQQFVIDRSSRTAMHNSSAVVVSSEDYARHSRLWASIRPSMVAIPPPCRPCPGGTPHYRDGDGFHVGFLGRIVAEKGLEYLVRGFQTLEDPRARLLIGGDYTNVAGGSTIHRLRQLIRGDSRIRLLGFVPDERLPDLYASMDVLALPSVNAFEAFGIVQVVAMLRGVPVLVSNLPGVRVPVRETGFGEIVAPRDAGSIGRALGRMKAADPMPRDGIARAADRFDLGGVIDAYETLFEKAASDLQERGR